MSPYFGFIAMELLIEHSRFLNSATTIEYDVQINNGTNPHVSVAQTAVHKHNHADPFPGSMEKGSTKPDSPGQR